MAGSYPDVPGYRFAYDIDGSSMVRFSANGEGTITTIDQGSMGLLNRGVVGTDDRAVNIGSTSGMASIIFPEPRTITGYYLSIYSSNPSGGRTLETSNDTINGQDGNWTMRSNPFIYTAGNASPSVPSFRSAITTVNWTNVKALRFRFYAYIYAVHLYGSVPPTESPHRLRIVDVSANDIAAQMDFGNLLQRASSTRQFKIINNSTTLTANSVTVSLNLPSVASPSLLGQYQISTDNVGFANAINIGTLAPGAESNILYVRMNPAANAQLGLWDARIIAHPTSWSEA